MLRGLFFIMERSTEPYPFALKLERAKRVTGVDLGIVRGGFFIAQTSYCSSEHHYQGVGLHFYCSLGLGKISVLCAQSVANVWRGQIKQVMNQISYDIGAF